MKLNELILQFKWSEIEVRFPVLYPDQMKNRDGYKEVYLKLKTIQAQDSTMIIQVETMKDDCYDIEYAHVNGRETDLEKVNDEEGDTFSLMLTPWPRWLGMEVSEEAFKIYGKLGSLVHILWEMTYVGYQEEDVTKTAETLNDKKDE